MNPNSKKKETKDSDKSLIVAWTTNTISWETVTFQNNSKNDRSVIVACAIQDAINVQDRKDTILQNNSLTKDEKTALIKLIWDIIVNRWYDFFFIFIITVNKNT